MKSDKNIGGRVFVVGQAALPASVSVAPAARRDVWRWGSDNRLPEALATLARSSTIHRRIINDKADYISGSGLTVDPSCPRTAALVKAANGQGQSLRTIVQRLALDRCLLGNAFLEIVTDAEHGFLSLYHQDATQCRLARDGAHVVLHHDWRQYRASEAVVLPLYPRFEPQPDGTLRSVIHYKDYEPMFRHYGVPKYMAGLSASAIIWKTDRWNISRLDNAFQPSGVMVLDGDTDSEQEADEIVRMAEERFAGRPGQVMFLVKNGIDSDSTKFVPITTTSDGDWKSLHDQAVSDMIVAHSWFRTLSGLEYTTGFSAERVRYEYNIALNTLIRVEQQELIEPLRAVCADIFGEQTRSLTFVNQPPFEVKPEYMRVWEARKADGYDYDPDDPAQQLFLSQI
ncbi:phage portal family protein [Millionella massiliensis]|uniref:phage portal protein n=1 Tax=Millionella massiliensis TaxID=1871023 RepID=UPI0008DA9F9E|nr:phage portal protein [Millionella massiliensis]